MSGRTWYDVTAPPFCARGDGTTDDRAAINAAIAAAKATRGTVYFPRTCASVYKISKYLLVDAADDLEFVCDAGVKILYPSADTTVTTDATADSLNKARGAFYILDSDRVRFTGFTFEGNTTEASNAINAGVAIYVRQSQDVHIEHCRNVGGYSLLWQDVTSDDVGLRLRDSVSVNARGHVTTGSDALVQGCRFELPTSSGYDAGIGSGSTHAIYIFAGRTNVAIDNCVFRNIRTNCLKVSGSVAPIRNVTFTNNKCYDCGCGIEYGADDTNEHANVIVLGNIFYDCGTNRSGWNNGQAISVLGARSVDVSHNQLYYTRDALVSTSGLRGIYVRRYSGSGSPLEHVQITHNVFQALLSGGASSPGAIMAQAISVWLAGQGQATTRGSVLIAHNTISGVASLGIYSYQNVAPRIIGNTFADVVTAIQCKGNRIPEIADNRLVVGPATSDNAQIRLERDSFPVAHNNFAIGRIGNHPRGQSMTISANSSADKVDHPLLGTHGKVTPAEGRPEVVFAYGDEWVDGDYVLVGGNTFTYRASSPGVNEFNTPAGLIALIDGLASYTCEDYGAPWGVTIDHLRVRWSSASTTANLFGVQTVTTHVTAGVALPNGPPGQVDVSFSRGEDTAPGSTTVTWSPLAHHAAAAELIADNAAAATLLKNNGWYTPARDPDDSGVSHTFEHGNVAATPATERFRWVINS